jgi:hypothetical protein
VRDAARAARLRLAADAELAPHSPAPAEMTMGVG